MKIEYLKYAKVRLRRIRFTKTARNGIYKYSYPAGPEQKKIQFRETVA